jgi:hypothetical protein
MRTSPFPQQTNRLRCRRIATGIAKPRKFDQIDPTLPRFNLGDPAMGDIKQLGKLTL